MCSQVYPLYPNGDCSVVWDHKKCGIGLVRPLVVDGGDALPQPELLLAVSGDHVDYCDQMGVRSHYRDPLGQGQESTIEVWYLE